MRRSTFARIAIVLILVVLALLLTRAPRALGTRVAWLGVIQRPVGSAVIGATSWIDAVGQALRNPGRLIALEGAITELRVARASLERELLDARSALAERGITYARRLGEPQLAHVVAATFTPDAHILTVEIDTGGPITIGQPVVARGAFIGTVIASGSTRMVVQLLGDPRTRLAVELAGAPGTLGVLEADPGGGLVVAKIPVDRSITPDALVVTGHLDARTPSEIPIGVISEVRRDPDGFFQAAAIDPLVDPRQQTVVTILMQVKSEE